MNEVNAILYDIYHTLVFIICVAFFLFALFVFPHAPAPLVPPTFPRAQNPFRHPSEPNSGQASSKISGAGLCLSERSGVVRDPPLPEGGGGLGPPSSFHLFHSRKELLGVGSPQHPPKIQEGVIPGCADYFVVRDVLLWTW